MGRKEPEIVFVLGTLLIFHPQTPSNSLNFMKSGIFVLLSFSPW
jgi:hypothetical protein